MNDKSELRVRGFRSGAAKAAVRYQNRFDVGIIIADDQCSAAGLFTTNPVKAPSVVLSKNRLKNGRARAVLANSGNANACVGPRGLEDAKECTAAVGQAAGIEPGMVLMSSTGVIGEPLPVRRVISSIPALMKAARPDGLHDFAQAIMTTDTRPKTSYRRLRIGSSEINLAGVAKGAGMIMPNLATMLAYIITDAEVESKSLKAMLREASADSFNALTVEGDTSTSDAVIAMASGAAKGPHSKAGMRAFRLAFHELCLDLALQIAADGEGATKLAKINVQGARSRNEADKIARRVANSVLVKTALFAGDPNWGRIMAAIGSAGVPLNPDKIQINLESNAGDSIKVVEDGAAATGYKEKQAAKILHQKDVTIRIMLGRGTQERTIYTCDMSPEYVKINAEYRS